ncbi:MAG: beta-lactamase family protein [Fimbriimonadaceae bacterium]|nr:beta-lactamase family protein [Fimbriimonadaceae bacterium]
MRVLRYALVSALVLIATFVRADALDDLVSAEMQTEHISGIAIGIVKDGKLIERRNYGLANRETCVPVGSQTVFRIASLSKAFTSAAVLMLADEGKVRLDEPVKTYVSDVPTEWAGITVRHCLNHISGIPDVSRTKWDITKDYTEAEFFELFKGLTLESKPGEKYAYSNFGYSTLGILVHRVSGKPLWEFVKQRIFEPLGMTNTYYYQPELSLKPFAVGYEYEEGKFELGVTKRPMIYSGSGGVMSCVEDLAKWDAALRSGTLIKQSIKDPWWTAGKLNDGTSTSYGMGWMLSNRNGLKNVHHTGTTPGFTAMICRYLENGITVIVLRNGLGTKIREFCDSIAKLYLPETRQTLLAFPSAQEPLYALIFESMKPHLQISVL